MGILERIVLLWRHNGCRCFSSRKRITTMTSSTASRDIVKSMIHGTLTAYLLCGSLGMKLWMRFQHYTATLMTLVYTSTCLSVCLSVCLSIRPVAYLEFKEVGSESGARSPLRSWSLFTRDICTGRYCWERVLAMAILSVCLSVCLSQPGAEPSPGEIETPGLHHMVAWSI